MPRRDAHVVVLAEDKQQHAFVSRLLQGLGFQPRRVRRIQVPADKTGGATFVLQRYAAEVKACRAKVTHQKSRRLLVIIDADEGDIGTRLRELDARLEADGQPTRGQGDGIAIFVPNRSIETWIEWLRGHPVDESTQYRRLRGQEKECAAAVRQLLELMQGGKPLPEDCPPSLVAAIEEVQRLK